MFEVKEKPRMVERALLVGVHYPKSDPHETTSLLSELADLVETLEVAAVHRETVRIKSRRAKFLVGTGKAASIIALAREKRCDCIVFDVELTPGQQRNWEKESGLCVIDRHEVILDIFAERAHTREAALQVDLARMRYSLPRLKRAWTHLSRQRGGGVTQRGEGEAQIEIDQRLVRTRISRLRKDLEEVVRHREVQRSRRMRVPLPTGAIVGYTNAGKSSLLNRLTDANVAVEDKLFATLDPTTRRLELPSGHAVLLTDTVGFIRRLPHHLIEAFKATLEEAVFADFLLHVVDITSPEADRQAETTLEVLKELGAGEKPIITVYNKIDLIHEERLHDYRIHDDGDPAYASVKTGTGIESLITRIEYHVMSAANYIELLIPHHRYDMVARFHRDGHVDEEDPRDDGFYLKGSIEPRWMKPFEEFRIANRGRTIAGASEPQLR